MMRSNNYQAKSQSRKSEKILGMTYIQVIILVVVACALFGLVGIFALLIIKDASLLENIQPVAPISFPTRIPSPTRTPVLTISGNSSDYLPTQNELPAGFVLVSDQSGPITSSYGDFYELAFTNSDNLFLHREVNVFYTAGIANSVRNAMDVYNSISDPSIVQGLTTREPFQIGEFTNVDEVTLLFGQETTELGNYAINYTLVFRYQNFIANIIVSVPVDSFTDSNAIQMQNRLRKAIVFYSSFVVNKLPVRHLANVPQPPFGTYSTPTATLRPIPTNTPNLIDLHTDDIGRRWEWKPYYAVTLLDAYLTEQVDGGRPSGYRNGGYEHGFTLFLVVKIKFENLSNVYSDLESSAFMLAAYQDDGTFDYFAEEYYDPSARVYSGESQEISIPFEIKSIPENLQLCYSASGSIGPTGKYTKCKNISMPFEFRLGK